MNNINEILEMTNKNKQVLPDTKCLITETTFYVFEIEILKGKKKISNKDQDDDPYADTELIRVLDL